MKKIILVSCSLITFLFSNQNLNYIDGMKYKNEKNFSLAESKFSIACKNDSIKESCHEAGIILSNSNKLKSLEMFKTGCDLDDKVSCIQLANIYLVGKENGGVVDKNEELADKYYLKGMK